MRLSRKGDYALRAVIQIALSGDKPCSINHISAAGNIPRNFAAKILKQLTDAGILRSFSGKMGGYTLAKDASDISFRQIIEAVEGPIIINRCLDKTYDCSRSSFCSMYDAWMSTQREMVKILDDVRIDSVIEKELKLSLSENE